VIPGQGTAGAPVPAPSNTSTEQPGQTQAPQQPATKAPPTEEVQKRIDRMYARLQDERRRREAAENINKLHAQPKQTFDEDGNPVEPEQKQITEADVQRAAEQAVDRKERDKRFLHSETQVFLEHPNALDTNGNFNMQDPWVRRYIEIGKQNPGLAVLENGPELAAAMVDKELGVDFKKGRVTEAHRAAQTDQSYTSTSTTAVPPTTGASPLNDAEKKVARRMNMTDSEYAASRGANQVKQRTWEVKPR
jgi:hypothetical protein